MLLKRLCRYANMVQKGWQNAACSLIETAVHDFTAA